MIKIPSLRSIHKRTWLKATGIAAGILIVLFATGFIIIRANMKTIQAAIDDSIKDRVNGTVSIGSVDITLLNHFPHFSVVLRNVKITDTSFADTHVVPFQAKEIYLQIHVFSLLKHKIDFRALTLNNASVNITKLSNGKFNTTGLFIKPANSDSVDINTLLLSRLYLREVNLHFKNMQTQQDYNFTYKESTMRISNGDSVSSIRSKDRIYVTGLLFKPERGPCLAYKTLRTELKMEWNRFDQTIFVNTSSLSIDKNRMYVSGSMDMKSIPSINLTFRIASVQMQTALSWVSNFAREKLKGYDFEKPLTAQLHVKGQTGAIGGMDMDLNFRTANNTFTTPTQKFESVGLRAHYFNYVNDSLLNDLSNSALEFASFKATYEGIPFSMKFKAVDLTDPMMDMHVHCDVPLTQVNGALDTSTLVFSTGKIFLDADFKGKLQGYTEKEKDSMTATIVGKAEITDAACRMPHKNYFINNMSASIEFNERDIQVNNMQLILNNNPLTIQASVSHFVDALVLPDSKLTAIAEVSCPLFNLNKFSKPTETTVSTPEKKHIAAVVANILDNLEGSLAVNVGSITYHKFILNNVHGKIVLSNSYIACENVSMNAAKGSLTLNGKIDGIGRSRPVVNFTADIANADITTLFYQLANFNQHAVTSKNVEGTISAHATLQAAFDRSFNIDPLSLNGSMNFTVKNGALTDMSSLNEISKNVFRKKDFSNIQFAELINSTTISGRELHIDNMEIQSNVLAMYVQGIYSFGDSTSLFIRIPVKSLRVQETDYIAENRAPDEKIGMSINLKATKVDGKLKVIPVVFHKADHGKSSVQQ